MNTKTTGIESPLSDTELLAMQIEWANALSEYRTRHHPGATPPKLRPILPVPEMDPDIARPADVIDFEGRNLLVVEYGGIRYTKAKPIIELCGIDWRSAKRTLKNMDNPGLYGCIWLRQSAIWGYHNHAAYRPALHVRVARSHLLLARISTNRMRATGKHAAADALLEMQNRWADRVHRYEFERWQQQTQPVRDDFFDDLDEAQRDAEKAQFSLLENAITIRDKLTDPDEISAFDRLIRAELRAMCTTSAAAPGA